MKKELAIIFFLLTISIFFIGYNNIYSRDTEVEGKKVIIIGKAVILNQQIEVEGNEKKSTILTSSGKMGILTAVDPQSSKYVAFAHEIPNNELENIICYETKNLGVNKSNENLIGSLTGEIRENKRIGNVVQNKTTGVSGIIDNIENYCRNEKEIYISSKYKIKKGKATIYLDLDGNGAKEYSIKIESINYKEDTKNMKIKVTDEELLNKTGGIVRGMSGTPVLQNGKLIGAINSVTLYDNAEGYAIFASSLFE